MEIIFISVQSPSLSKHGATPAVMTMSFLYIHPLIAHCPAFIAIVSYSTLHIACSYLMAIHVHSWTPSLVNSCLHDCSWTPPIKFAFAHYSACLKRLWASLSRSISGLFKTEFNSIELFFLTKLEEILFDRKVMLYTDYICSVSA